MQNFHEFILLHHTTRNGETAKERKLKKNGNEYKK